MRHLGARVVTALASAALVGTMVGAPASSATAASATTSASTTRLASSDTRPSPAYPCRGYGLLDRQNPVGDLDRDLFTWGPYKKTRVGNGRHDINWALDPHKQDSWKTLFHSLNWTGAYIYRSTQGMTAQRDPKAIDNAVAIAQDWVRDNRYPWPTGPGAGNATHTRADFLMCLRDGLQQVGKPVPRWLDTSLVQHATWLRANTWPDHNVGTEQTLAVMGIGCTLRRNDLRTYAVDKLGRDITRVIDAQGANNEQAVGYARYNHALWGYVENALTACNVDTRASRTITSRRDALQGFLDHAVKPDGTFHQLGDTQVEKPQAHAMSPAQEW
ncbi:MAG: hypothetical protein Q4F67_14740, partial [Propionibacteriaceae bacterium]|nr:hypothetical protein [Propionibacteriaceae bacterium]